MTAAPLFRSQRLYTASLVFSVLFALAGFTYNVWRMEVTEENSNIRTACFEMLLTLSEFEQLLYVAHYDGDLREGSPRKGWVRVNLVEDLSVLAGRTVEARARGLKAVWGASWAEIATEREAVDRVVQAIDGVRAEIKRVLRSLE